MNMSPMVKSDPEDAWYDALIAEELERINLSDEEREDLKGGTDQDEECFDQPVKDEIVSEETVSEALDIYLKRIQHQTEQFEMELEECDQLIQYQGKDTQTGSVALVPVDDVKLLEQAAAEHGVDPETYRKQILLELDRDEEEGLDFEEEELKREGEESLNSQSDQGGAGDDGQPGVMLTEMTPEALSYENPREERDTSNQGETTLNEENSAIVLADPSWQFREFLKDQWHATAEKQRRREALEREKTELIRKEEEEYERELDDKRQKRKEEITAEEKQLAEALSTKTANLEKEIEEKEKVVNCELEQFEKSIKELEQMTEKEKEELSQQQTMAREKQERQLLQAATKLQSAFRGYRLRKVYGDELKQKSEKRKQDLELKKVEEKEQELLKLEEKKKELERLDKEEKRKREIAVEEKIKAEEEEKRKKEEVERKKAEEEKRKKEEEDRKKAEKEAFEAEQRKKEQERKTEEAERNRKEEAERLKKEEAERLKKEEAERLKKEVEQKRKEEEKKQKEEAVRREKEAERRRKEEELQKKKEDEERRKVIEEEKKRKEEQQRKKPEEEAERKRVAEQKLLEEKKKENEAKVNQPEKEQESLVTKSLPEDLEKKRRQWMKDCSPWSKVSTEPWKKKQAPSKKLVKRPSSAKKLPPLSEQILLQAAQSNSLSQVTTVQMSDLPGFSLSPLGQCPHLRHLAVTHCGLRAVEGINTCKQLQYIDLQSNEIQYVDLNDLENLEYVNLSSNQLTAIHGLEGCTNLRWLDMSHNKLIKLGWLCGLRRLHTLNLSHNQLMSTAGLGEAPTLQTLHLSHNNLQRVEGIHSLCLLQSLVLTGNTILEIPSLANQVLLQELRVDDNSITSLDPLMSSWLPCLQKLNVSQNSISEIGEFSFCLILQNLDISNNQILDGEELASCLKRCCHLSIISVEGNPGADEFRSVASSCLPSLRTVDSEKKTGPLTPVKPRCSFEAMCISQTRHTDDLYHTFTQSLRSSECSGCPLGDIFQAHSVLCCKDFDLAVEHRYAHEYGEITLTWPTAPSEPKPLGRPQSGRGRSRLRENVTSPEKGDNSGQQAQAKVPDCNLENTPGHDNQKDILLTNPAPEKEIKSETVLNVVVGQRNENECVDEELQDGSYPDNAISSLTSPVKAFEQRIPILHKEISASELRTENPANNDGSVTAVNSQATDIARVTSDVSLTSVMGVASVCTNIGSLSSHPHSEWTTLDDAATVIQAAWRGYSLRSRLLQALEYARLEDSDEGEEFGEVDLDDFNFDMGDLDDEWKPPPTPKIPSSHPLLGKPPSGRVTSDVTTPHHPPPQPPSFPRQAWRNLTSPLSHRASPSGRPPRPLSSALSGSDTHRTGMSKKEEMLSEEWGFKDTRTAELMLQRAKKMKYNADKRKKLSKLDPKQKLALFKKLSETTRMINPVQTVAKKVMPRKEYFQVNYCWITRAREAEDRERDKRTEVATKASRTYEWLHTQVGELPSSGSTHTMARSESETSLPRFDDNITAGRRVQLVGSPVPLELESVASLEESGRHRRFSFGDSSATRGVNASPVQFPPIKTNSAPSTKVKERMSWRTKKTTTDIGWGGGRKRSHFT